MGGWLDQMEIMQTHLQLKLKLKLKLSLAISYQQHLFTGLKYIYHTNPEEGIGETECPGQTQSGPYSLGVFKKIKS